jgi:hypothetical protein
MERMMESDNDSLVLDLSSKIGALKSVCFFAVSALDLAEQGRCLRFMTLQQILMPFAFTQLTVGIGDEVRSQNAFLDDMV